MHIKLTCLDIEKQVQYVEVPSTYSKTCLKWPLKIDKTNVLKIDGSLIQVESIAECSPGAFCNTFDLHLAIIGFRTKF